MNNLKSPNFAQLDIVVEQQSDNADDDHLKFEILEPGESQSSAIYSAVRYLKELDIVPNNKISRNDSASSPI